MSSDAALLPCSWRYTIHALRMSLLLLDIDGPVLWRLNLA